MKLIALTACGVDFYPQNDLTITGGNSLNVAAMWKVLDPECHVTTRKGPTTCNQLWVEPNGERYGIEGTWLGGVNENFLLSEKDWELVANQDLIAIPANSPNFKEMLSRRRGKQILAVDYLDMENGMNLVGTIDQTDIAFIAGSIGDLPALRKLAFNRDRLLVLTLGVEGSRAFYRGEEYQQPPIPVQKVKDTTGCGDAYQAAFALSFLKTGDVKSSMKSAAEAASKVVQILGGPASLFKESSNE